MCRHRAEALTNVVPFDSNLQLSDPHPTVLMQRCHCDRRWGVRSYRATRADDVGEGMLDSDVESVRMKRFGLCTCTQREICGMLTCGRVVIAIT